MGNFYANEIVTFSIQENKELKYSLCLGNSIRIISYRRSST